MNNSDFNKLMTYSCFSNIQSAMNTYSYHSNPSNLNSIPLKFDIGGAERTRFTSDGRFTQL